MNKEFRQAPITVLMAVYNGEQYVQTAIDSILKQSFDDFRFLIVDDASTDSTRQIVGSMSDPRIELVSLPRNGGQTAALNYGLRHAGSDWIARMDADDFSAPNRLEEQFKALKRFPQVQCVGTAIWEFSQDPHVRGNVYQRPATEEEIKRAVLFGGGIVHGSVLIGRQALLDVGGYDERYRYAADREMFIRFTRKHKAMNLPEPLLGIRRHAGQDSFSKKAADEYIDIFVRLLAGGDYAGKERRLLLDGLAYSYLFRAGYFYSQHQYRLSLEDLFRSLSTSPYRALRTLAGQAAKGLAKK